MAKKKLFSGVKNFVKNTEYVKEQKPKTVSLGSSLQNTYKSSEPVQRQMSERERAEKERSNKMRSSALVSIAKTMSKNSASTYKTTLPSVASKLRAQSASQAPKYKPSSSVASVLKSQTKAQAPKTRVTNTIARNALAPVNKYAESHMVTGGHGVGTYGFKTSVRQKALAPAKEIAEYTRKQQNKYVYTPNNDYRFDANGNMLTKKDPISIEYGKKLRAGMPSTNTAIMSWRGDPTKEELKYRDRYGFTDRMNEALDRRLNENMLEASYSPTTGEITEAKNGRAISAGFTDAFARENLEDTIRRQYGIEPDENMQSQIEAQRNSLNYGAGMAAGQMAQYALTRGLLGTAGLVGKSAEAISDTNKVVRVLENRGVKTGTAKAITALMEEMGIDQAASVPLNLVDAMKADGGANVIKRFGINQGLDVLFSGLFEIPSLRRNLHFLNGNEMNEAANAMQEGTEKLSTKIGAKGHLDTAMDETGDVARQEAENIAVGRIGAQRPIASRTADADEIARRYTNMQEYGQLDEPVEDLTFQMRRGMNDFDNAPNADIGVEEAGERFAATQNVTPRRQVYGELGEQNNESVYDATYRLFKNWGNDDASRNSYRELVDRYRNMSPSELAQEKDSLRRAVDESSIDPAEAADRTAVIDAVAREKEKLNTTGRQPANAEPKVETPQERVETPRAKAKPKEEPKTKAQAEQPKAKVSNSASDEEIDRLVREQTKEMYDKMSTDELQAELRWLGKNPTVTPDVEGAAEMGIKEAMDSDEVAQRTDIINEILAERGANGSVKPNVDRSREEVFVSEEQVDKVFNDAIRKRSYRFETLRAYPRAGDMRIIIGDRAYDERGFRRLIREDLERTKAQVNEAINARAAKVGKQKASVEEPKAEPKAEAKAEEPKKRNQVKGVLNNEEPKRNQVKGVLGNEEPKAKTEDTRTWQEKAKADFYESSKNRAKDVKKGKIPSRESGEVVNAIKRLKETVDFSDMKDTLERGIKDGFYNRKIRHLDEEMDKAIKEIEEDPEKAINDILKYHPNGEKGADIPADAVPFVMKGYALCKWADQNGMKALKEDIAATMAKAQSAGGSVLRAGQVFTVMADSHTQRDIVADFVEKMQTKYAKRLGDHKLSVPEDLLKKLDDATTDAEKSKALDDISVHVWNQVPQSFFDAFSGLRIISMLANTTTMIRNVASNVAFLGVRETDKVVNTVMESTAEKLNKIDKEHRTHSFYNPFSKENRKIKSFWDNDYGNNSNIIKGQSRWDESGGALNVDFRHEDARHYGVKAGGGKKGGLVGGVSSGIEAARKVTTLIMDKGDEIFLRPAYSDAATQLMHARGWGIDDLTPARIQEIRDYATDVAQKATYRDPSDAAMALAKWGHWQKGDGGLRLFRAIVVSGLQPFKKTPINIGKRSVEYSPLGFVKGVWDIGAAVHAGDSKAVNKAITELSHGTTGTGLVVAGYLLAQQGLVNAKLPSDDEGYLRKDLGEQDYALTLNGKSRSLQWAAPGAVPILAGATLYDQIRQRGWNSLVHPAALVSVLSESTNPLLEMSFMQSYMDIADVTDDVEGTAKILVGLEQIGLSYAAQFIPTALGKLANVIDPVRRDTSSQNTDPYEKAVERFINKSIINKIPNVGKWAGKEWGSASLPAYIDYKGDEQVTEKMSDRIVENFISPWYTKDIKDDPVAKEVIKVNKYQDENVIFKSSMDKGKHELKFDGKTYNLDAHEMEDYKKVRGKANYNNVKKLMNSAEYKSMSWSEKGKAMKKEEDAATAEAKTEALLKKGLDEWLVRTDGMSGGKKESVDAAKDLGLKPKEYVNVVNDPTVDLDENGTLSQYEVYTYLEKTDYPTEVKDMFWRAFNKGWTSDKTNPYRGGKLPTPPDPDDVELKKAKEEAKTLSKAKPRDEGSLAAKAFEKSVLKRATETASLLEDSGSGSSKGSSRRGRSGRRGGGGSGSSKRKQTASERKFANGTGKLPSVDLEKIYKQAKIEPAKVPTTSLVKAYTQVQQASKTKKPTPMDIKVKGLTKSQKKAMLKVMLKKLDTKR